MKVDCEDSDCQEEDLCIEGDRAEECFDDIDNNNNGLIDCDDQSHCAEHCIETGDECFDFVDNNRNGLLDCAEPDCKQTSFCVEGDSEEECFDRFDNNLNGLIDCDEPRCADLCAEGDDPEDVCKLFYC